MAKVNLRIKTYFKKPVTLYSDESRIAHHLKNSTILEVEEACNSTFDQVLLRCATVGDIPPLYLPLFNLRDPHTNYWIKLSSRLDTHDFHTDLIDKSRSQENSSCDIELRMRFTVKNECQIDGATRQAKRYSLSGKTASFLNENMLQYLFYQQREDFLQGHLKITADISDGLGSALGVAVLDMLRLAHILEKDVNEIRKIVPLKKLIPFSCQQQLARFSIFNRLRVWMKFRHYLVHFRARCESWLTSQCNRAFFFSKYLQNLDLVVGQEKVETYQLNPQTTFESDCTKIKVGADCGIVKYCASNKAGEKWCDFADITDMSLQIRRSVEPEITIYIVSLSQLNGSVIKLLLTSIQEAENLASCIDGYYQLLVDPHHYLCKDVVSPTIVERINRSCHGPMLYAFAEHILVTQTNKNVGNCLLRCSQESYDEYFMTTITQITPKVVIKNYKIDRVGKFFGIYGDDDSHCHSTLGSLIHECAGGQHHGKPLPFNVDFLLHPQIKQISNLLVQRCIDDDPNLYDGNISLTSHTTLIMQRDYSFVRHLGRGRYTEVKLYAMKQQPENHIVLKHVGDLSERLDLGQKQHSDESFQESMMKFICMNNIHIIKILGTMKSMLVLEYVPIGSITTFLQKKSELPSPEWFVYVLWQLTHACTYLENIDCPHGNISGKNILLWQSQPQPLIKLSDPGVRTCRRTLRHRIITEPVLTAPWLAFEFCKISNDPATSNPTIAGDKWSFATTVCEICNCTVYDPMNAYNISDEMKVRYTSCKVVPIPDLLSSVVVGDLNTLLQQCWSIYPYKRPAFREILRELGTVLSSDYVLPSIKVNRSIQTVNTHDRVTNQLQVYEDENLVWLQQLGEGHFGQVDLYQYDKDRNGRMELVAVKSLRRRATSPQSLADIENEIKTMKKITHKYVVKLKGVAEPSVRIVMEYLPCGSLSAYLQNRKQEKVPIANLHQSFFGFASQIAQGMIALQEHRLIHRDLALRNILLGQTAPNLPLYIKIADFGLSRILAEDHDYYVGHPKDIPAQWYAPECLRLDGTRSFHFESDVWSFGVTVWEMFSYGAKPIYESLPRITVNDLCRLEKLLKKGDRLNQPLSCPDEVYSIMMQCWSFDRSGRIKFGDLRRKFDILCASCH